MIKPEVLLDGGDHAYQKFLFQQCEKRIEKLSQQNKLSKFSIKNGQYFMTKDIGDFTQFKTLAYREYTHPSEGATSQSKGWIQGNTFAW